MFTTCQRFFPRRQRVSQIRRLGARIGYLGRGDLRVVCQLGLILDHAFAHGLRAVSLLGHLELALDGERAIHCVASDCELGCLSSTPIRLMKTVVTSPCHQKCYAKLPQ
jgi:hypothetical protein